MKTLLHLLTRLLTKVFFRRVIVVGQERIPASGSMIAVANHVNGLIDPLLVFSVLPRLPRSLAKSTLWEMKFLGSLMNLGGVIPVYRRMDEGVDTSKNQNTFELCYDAIAQGDTLVLFPEGIAHDFPELQPLRTGAARIALKAEALHGPLGVLIQPIGLTFDDKHTFRSTALVTVAEPFPLFSQDSPFADSKLDDSPDLVRDLTDRIDKAIREQTLNYETWEAARRFSEAADVVLWREDARLRVLELAGESPGGVDLTEPLDKHTQPLQSFKLKRALEKVYPSLVIELPEQTRAAEVAVSKYHQAIEESGLRHELVASSSTPSRRLRYGVRIALELLFLLPMTAVGFVLNAVPYPLPRMLAERSGDRHLAATYKVYTSLVIYPVVWCLEALVAGFLGGVPWFLAVLVLAPLGGYVALRFFESGSDLVRRILTFVKLRRSAQRQEIRRLKAEVDSAIDDLLAELGRLAS